MVISGRAGAGEVANDLALLRAQLEAQGVVITDLTDSNPTRFGLCSKDILEVVAQATANAGHYEPDPRGAVTAREALAAHFGGEAGDYWLTASTSEAYSWLFALLADPGDRVAVPAPGYPLIEPLARLAAIETIPYTAFYLHPYGWSYDPGSIREAMTGRTRALVAVNPANPTGAYVDAATRTVMIEACRRAGAALVADEVFGPFRLDADPSSGPSEPNAPSAPTSLAGEREALTFALGGLSKLLAAPQLKLGWIRVSGPPDQVAEVVPVLDRIADTFLSVGTPIAAALPQLLELAGATVNRIRQRLQANLAAAREIFDPDVYRVRRADGGWTILVDVPRRTDDDTLGLHLLRDAHLSVHPGWFYDCPDSGVLALSLLPEPDDFADGCRRLVRATQTWSPSP